MSSTETAEQRVDTHWTRILYHDLYAPHAGAAAAPAARPRKEIPMASKPSHEDRLIGRTPLGAAMVLLGIYIAMYLAVAEAVQVLSPPDAAAAVAREHAPAAADSPADAPIYSKGGYDAKTD